MLPHSPVMQNDEITVCFLSKQTVFYVKSIHINQIFMQPVDE